jgi:hypothetical protein
MIKKLRKIRRRIVVIKYTMARGYVWCQTPTMALVAAGVIKPYFPNQSIYSLAALGFATFLIVGFIDKKFKFLDEELSYATAKNSLLMKELTKR